MGVIRKRKLCSRLRSQQIGRVDRTSTSDTADFGSIPCGVKPTTIQIGIHSFPAWRSALKGTVLSLHRVWWTSRHWAGGSLTRRPFAASGQVVIVITVYTPSCLGQETAKEPFDLRVKLPPVDHTRQRLRRVHLIVERQAGKLGTPIFIVFSLILSGIEPESTGSVATINKDEIIIWQLFKLDVDFRPCRQLFHLQLTPPGFRKRLECPTELRLPPLKSEWIDLRK